MTHLQYAKRDCMKFIPGRIRPGCHDYRDASTDHGASGIEFGKVAQRLIQGIAGTQARHEQNICLTSNWAGNSLAGGSLR